MSADLGGVRGGLRVNVIKIILCMYEILKMFLKLKRDKRWGNSRVFQEANNMFSLF